MALDVGVPPWLQATPALYQRAIEAGAQTGLGLSRLADAARDSALDRAAREASLAATLAARSEENALTRDLQREHYGQQLAIEEARGNREDSRAQQNYTLRQAAADLARQKMENLEDYRGSRLDQSEAALQARIADGDPAVAAERQAAADKIKRQKEIDTFRAGAAGAKAMLNSLTATSDPALRDKYMAQEANFTAKADELEAILKGEGAAKTAPKAPAYNGKAWRYTPGKSGAGGTLQILQR